MIDAGTAEIIKAIELLQAKITAWLNNQGEITPAEYGLFMDLADWYQTKGIPLAVARRNGRSVDPADFKVSVRWGGKDGKWRWLAEAADGQSTAGEERVLSQAFTAGGKAVEGMQR